jgi:hypothetical protein
MANALMRSSYHQSPLPASIMGLERKKVDAHEPDRESAQGYDTGYKEPIVLSLDEPNGPARPDDETTPYPPVR